MSKSFVSLCLLRVIYPICLTACVSCRQDLITSIFLLFLLYIPFVPVPTPRTMSGHTGFFLKLNFIISTVALCLQVIFQIFLLTYRQYGEILSKNCGHLEKLFLHIGFISYGYSLSLWNTALHIAPEVIAIFSSFFVYVFCDRLNPACPDSEQVEEGLLANIVRTPGNGRDARRSLMKKKGLLVLAIIGKYLSLVMLCFASILVPSFTSGFLYVVFLCCVTYWACYKDFGRNFAYLCRFLCIIICLYVVAIFCYQTEWAQELLPPTTDLAKNLGLQALRLSNCSVDVRAFIPNPTLTWPSFVLPYALILLFYLLICESGLLLFVSLIRGRESVYRRSGTTGMSQDSQGSITITNSPEEKVDLTADETNEGEESFKVDIMEYLVDAFITLMSFITRTSYIGTNIIMMTWSITYHSWLTFLLLLGAIILWMVPNQRQSMLRLSPFLVAYAIFLLLTQYLFDLDFVNEELVSLHINISSVDREQIGFPKSNFPVKELCIKTLFTVMFWITMRQYMGERQESRSTSTVAHMMAPVQITVGTATAIGGDPSSKGGQVMQKFGEQVRKLLTKFWIWVVTITLFAIGILGDQMNLFRILYMALALVFILTFQLSWVIWRKIMYGFWLVVIITSMIVLVTIYTFQFDGIKHLWEKIGVDETWQQYIGLEKKSAGDLFLFLIAPTFFVIITVIQLKYFHKDFLTISDIRSRGNSTNQPKSRPSILSDDEYATQVEDVSSKTEPASPEDVHSPGSSKALVRTKSIDLQTSRPSFHVFGRAPNVETLQTIDSINQFLKDSIEVLWMFMELHIKKFILVIIMVISISEVNAIHLIFVISAVVAMMLNAALQDIVIRLISVTAAAVLLLQMVFQIKHFTVNEWAVTCQDGKNSTYQLFGTTWVGFYKIGEKSMLQLLSGYIWIIFAVTMYVVVLTRQKYVRHVKGRPLSRNHVLFPRISYREANNGVIECIQYLFNYGFYRFGIEITLISIVFLIGTRKDVIALFYAVWLIVIVVCSRATISKIWYILNLFIAISIPVQYAICVGLPPQFCFVSFEEGNVSMQQALKWLFLPVKEFRPDVTLLMYDFIVLLFVTRQTKVFRTEYQHKDNDYSGGSNKSIVHEMENPNYINPIPDFISDKKSYLDIIKHGVLCSLLWISCAVAFLAGTTNVTLLSFGYVIESFLILWQGNDFYLRPINAILKWWNRFLIYNVSIIFLKAFFQIPGCIFYSQMESVCWLVKLLGIGCIQDFGFLNTFFDDSGSKSSLKCNDLISVGGMGGDAVCFILLILQKRLFSSHYFIRIVDDAKAMAVLAARGAEFIEELSRKQILKQQELEKAELKKIKNKMDSIKAAQKKIQGIKSKEITTHAEAIRSGDYYMFDDEESFNLVEVDELTAVDEVDEELHGKTLGKLMESVLRTDLKHALKSSAPDGHGDEPMKSPSTKSRSEMASKSTSSSAGDGDDEKDDDESSFPYKSTDATTSKDGTDSFDGMSLSLRRSKRGSDRKRASFRREDREHEGDKDKDDTSESEDALTSGDDEDSQPIQSCWDSFITYLKFAHAFINSCMISMIQFLNRKSRDYRYVILALDREKKTLKETRNLRMGMRIQPEMKWQPVPTGVGSQRSGSPLKMEDFESQGLIVSSQPVFVRLLLAIYHALMSHSDMVCYFAVFILQIKSPTLASLPLSLMVFFWGTLSIPRPTKRFWVTIIAYTEFIVVVRNICQADFVPMDPIPDDKPFYWARILGVEKNSSDSFYNLVLLLAVFFHRSTLKSLGLWKSAEEFNKDNKQTNLLNLNYVEPHRSSVVSGSDSDVVTELTTVNLHVPEQLQEGVDPSTESYQNQTTVPQLKVNSRSLSSSSENLLEPYTRVVTEFFNKLIDSKSRIADDVYAYMFFCDFLNIIVIIFGFSSFGAAKGDGGVTQYIEDNKIPFAFLAMVIIQFALIVVDRWLYLSRYIVGKLVFQYLLVVVIHIWMFFILPAVTERRFNDALPPSLWYLIKCFYLLLSAYQIRSGYPTRILGNFLSKNYNLVNMVLFKIFMLIPFVYELRTLMDWIWTETSMTLADWIKMEDIFAQIFQLKCLRRAESKYPLPCSQKIPAKTKFMYGAGGLVTLFTIIWFPLVLFALGNTVGEPNIPTDMYAKVQISSYQALYGTYTSKVSSLTEDQWKQIKDVYSSSASAQTFLSDYNPEDVGVVTLPTYSSSIWTIPPPEMTEIVAELDECSHMKISLEWTINRRSENPESPKSVSESNSVPLTGDICKEMNKVLNSTSSDNNVTIPYLMPKFLKVASIGKASPVSKLMKNQDLKRNADGSDSGTNPFINITFRLEQDQTTGNKWWSAFESIDSDSNLQFLKTIDDITTNHTGTKNKSLIIYTFNDKMFPPGLLSIISGKGIIGLYTTFVIVVGAYVKGYFTGTSSQIMFEDMPYVDRILQLCLDIYLVRERREFDLEEDLFAKLLFLYRSPETIIKWTRPPEDGAPEVY